MDVFEAIRSRRSIRTYTGEPVPDDLVEKIIEAGTMAPSAGNEQPWHFVVIRNRDTMTAISRAHPYAGMVQDADAVILVCGDLDRDEYKGYWVQDCAAATQNMLLAAHALGLGSVWVGIHPVERRVQEIRRIVALPEKIVPLALLPLGRPGETKPEEGARFDRARIHRDRW